MRLAALKGEGKVSLTAILVKLVAWVLERHPYINSSLIDEKIHFGRMSTSVSPPRWMTG